MFESINIDLLYVFVTVSELKSINKSSELLLLSQPAISNKIKKLEEHFGKKLLERSSKGVILTKDGEIFYHKAKNIIREFDALHNLDDYKTDNNFSSVKIGTFDSISSFLYPNFFASALEDAYSVTITNKISELIKPFNNGDLDIILADSELKKGISIDYSEVFLYTELYYVVFSKNNNKLSTSNSKKLRLWNYKMINYCYILNIVLFITK